MNFVDQYRRMPVGQVGNLALGPVPMPPAMFHLDSCVLAESYKSESVDLRFNPASGSGFRKIFSAFLPPLVLRYPSLVRGICPKLDDICLHSIGVCSSAKSIA